MLLSKQGFDVKIYEKHGIVGGRNGFIKSEQFTFDIGPTFFMMKNVLEQIFFQCGKKFHDSIISEAINFARFSKNYETEILIEKKKLKKAKQVFIYIN